MNKILDGTFVSTIVSKKSGKRLIALPGGATVTDILLTLAPYKRMTRETLYVHLRALKIKPLGKVRQIPTLYPASTAYRILHRLGLDGKRDKGRGLSLKINGSSR